MVIADTVKGKGVSFMENSVLWHYRTARGEEYEAARNELEVSSTMPQTRCILTLPVIGLKSLMK